MRLNFKKYKIFKTKNYIKKNNLYFFFGGIDESFKNWIFIEQKLKNMYYNYYKIFNKTTKKLFNRSIYSIIKLFINTVTFLIKPANSFLSKKVLKVKLKFLLFDMLSIKINNKVYQINQFKNNYSLSYKFSKLLFFQYGIFYFKSQSK